MDKATSIGVGITMICDFLAIGIGVSGMSTSRLIGFIIIGVGLIGGMIFIIIGFRNKEKIIKSESSPQNIKILLINKFSEAVKNFRIAQEKQEKDKFIAEFETIKQSCNDSKLDRMLSDYIRYELECDHFNFDYFDEKSVVLRDRFYTNTRDYIYNNTKNNILAALITLGIVAFAVFAALYILR